MWDFVLGSIRTCDNRIVHIRAAMLVGGFAFKGERMPDFGTLCSVRFGGALAG